MSDLVLREVREFRADGEYAFRSADCPWLAEVRVTLLDGFARLELYAHAQPVTNLPDDRFTVVRARGGVGGGDARGGGSSVTIGTNGR